MKITFVGHAFVFSSDEIKERVKNAIKNNVIGVESVECYIGGYGDFDDLCAEACRELRRDGYDLSIIYVTPYLVSSEQTKIRRMQEEKLFDYSIYPPIESVPMRLAIIKRNEWMVKNSDLIIAYVKHNYGGAYRTLQVAKRNSKIIIDVCD